MECIVLGTGNATATECYNTCFVLADETRPCGDRFFLVDGGGGNGLFRQLKRAGIDWREVRWMFVSHRHMDHIMGILWMQRMILNGMKHATYAGEATIYGCDEVVHVLRRSAELLLTPEECAFVGERLHLVTVEDGDETEIIGHRTTFYDVGSEKTRQFGLSFELESGRNLVFCGDEPCGGSGARYAVGAEWLLHEAFCLVDDEPRFCAHEKHHSTVEDACREAECLGVRNLVLYHTEDTDLAHRRARYSEEGRLHYGGNLIVPDDLEVIAL